jgi:hypothetical protein
MGYIPPSPPEAGQILILEPGVEYHEVTCLGDSERRYVAGFRGGRIERECGPMPRQMVDVEAELREIRHTNAIGFGLLVALALSSGYCIAQALGLA